MIRSFFLVLAVSLTWYFCAGRGAAEETIAPVEEANSQQEGAVARPLTSILTYVVRSGDTFGSILGGFGVPVERTIAIHKSLLSVGCCTLFPGDSIVLVRDSAKHLTDLSLLSRLRYWYRVRQTEDGSQAVEKEPLKVTRYRCVVKGVLESSLSEDMFRYGVGDALVAKLAEIFAWDINFFMDPRRGDRFLVLFEKKYREGRFIGYGDILAAKYINGDRAHYAIAYEDADGDRQYYDLKGKSVQKQFLKAPLRYRRISSGFSPRRRHPILGIYRPHHGVDYAAPPGTPVYAAADGHVVFAGRKGGYGKHVRIAHGGAYMTYYGHLRTIRSGVRNGAVLKQGELLGTVGSTGLSTGPHLDYRMKVGSRFVNPMTVSVPSRAGVGLEELPRFAAVRHALLFALESRFQEDGYYVLDVVNPHAAPVASVEQANPDSTHGIAAGS